MKVQIFKYEKEAPLFRGELLASLTSKKANRGEVNAQIEPLKTFLMKEHGTLTIAILTN
jgi:hypothetical protein